MAGLSIVSLSKSFGSTPVLREVSLEVADGEFLTLLGPSGCGKSTLLRIIAGLEQQSSGSVSIAGAVVDQLRPKQRNVAMVFQSYALYPHMTVERNMALPLRMRRLGWWQRLPFVGPLLPGSRATKTGIARDVAVVADAIGIGALLSRKPGQLSGGQRQRVAVGRAMVRNPAVFLMDEPLSNLDAKLRVQMRAEIAELHRRLGATFVYVTHDQVEAMTMSDRVAVMLDGALLQVASPADIYADPASRSVAEFVGTPRMNILPGVEVGGAVQVGPVLLALPDHGLTTGQSVAVGIRPEALALADRDGPGVIEGRVRLVEHLGADLFAHLEVVGCPEPVILRASAEQAERLQPGRLVHAAALPGRVFLFGEDGARLRPQMAGKPARNRVERAMVP